MYESVLIPTDGSEGSVGAIQEGIELARRFDATVHALSVVDLAYTDTSVSDVGVWESVFDARKRECESAIEELVTTISDSAPELSVTTAIENGYPSIEILAYADRHDIDCIAMGTHGRTGVRRYLLGSVTNAVVRHAEKPVLTVQLSESPVTTGHDEILIATDGSPGSVPAVEQAIELADQYDATLHVLSVVETKYASSAPIRSTLETAANRAITEVLDRTPAHIDTETHRRSGIVDEVIGDTIDEHDIDVLVLGTHGRRGMDRLLLGSVAERMIRTAAIPVLTVPAATGESA